MEFSSIGSYDSIEEAVQRIESCEILIVWGEEAIIGLSQMMSSVSQELAARFVNWTYWSTLPLRWQQIGSRNLSLPPMMENLLWSVVDHE